MIKNFQKTEFIPLKIVRPRSFRRAQTRARFLTGFTLAETLVSVAIFSIVAGAVYAGYSLNHKAYNTREADAEIVQNGRVILERLSREMRQAREIVGGLPDEEQTATSTIIFEDGHVESTYHYIHYFLDQNNLKREVLGYYFSGDIGKNLLPWNAIPPIGQTLEVEILEEEAIIGEYVSEIKFWGSGLIQISLDLKKQTQDINFRTKIYGRNF